MKKLNKDKNERLSVFCRDTVIFAVLCFVLLVGLPWLSPWIGIVVFLFSEICLPIIFFIAVIYFELAPNNLFFTFVKEGTAKVIVRGGKVVRIIIGCIAFDIDDKFNVTKKTNLDGFLRKMMGGLYFYGIWPIDDVLVYKFSWTRVTEAGDIHRHVEEMLDYILLRDDSYLCEVEKAEDKDLLPLSIQVVLIIKVCNPYKALFLVQDWLETTINIIKPAIRDEIRKDSFQNLVNMAKGGGANSLGQKIYEELKNNGTLSDLETRYGVKVRKIKIKEIDPPEELRSETLKRWSADREAERIVALANANADAMKIEAEAKKCAYEQITKVPEGVLLEAIRSIAESPLSAVQMLGLPGLQSLFSNGLITQDVLTEIIKKELANRGLSP